MYGLQSEVSTNRYGKYPKRLKGMRLPGIDLGPWAATSLGCPDLTPCRIPFTELPFGVHYAGRFHGGASKKVLQEGSMVGRADVRWGSVGWVVHCLL